MSGAIEQLMFRFQGGADWCRQRAKELEPHQYQKQQQLEESAAHFDRLAATCSEIPGDLADAYGRLYLVDPDDKKQVELGGFLGETEEEEIRDLTMAAGYGTATDFVRSLLDRVHSYRDRLPEPAV